MEKEEIQKALEELRPKIEKLVKENPDAFLLALFEFQMGSFAVDKSPESIAASGFSVGLAAASLFPEWSAAFRSVSLMTENSDGAAKQIVDNMPINLGAIEEK